VLLGDKDQLASVEAGAVLGELCRRARRHYTADTAGWLAGVTGERSARSSSTRPAGPSTRRWRCCATATASAATAGSASWRGGQRWRRGGRRLLRCGFADLARVAVGEGPTSALRRLVVEATPARPTPGAAAGLPALPRNLRDARPAAGAAQAPSTPGRAVLAAHGQFQLLCGLRRGPWGVEGLNRRIAGWLHEAG
jgi:exodeoxyribonuclease V alpha subunit